VDGPIFLESLYMAKKKRNNMSENYTHEEQIEPAAADTAVEETTAIPESESVNSPVSAPEATVSHTEPAAVAVNKNAGKVIPTVF
jgi:hypothetical protein